MPTAGRDARDTKLGHGSGQSPNRSDARSIDYPSMTWRRHFVMTVVLLGTCAAASAQAPSVDRLSAEYAAREERIKQISDQLDTGDVPDAALQSDLRTLLEYQDQLERSAQVLGAALKAPTASLKELGPPPAKDAPPESDAVATLRKSLNDDIARLTGLVKQAEINRGQVERLINRIRDLQGTRFLTQLGERSASPLSSKFWTDAAADIPPVLRDQRDHLTAWWGHQKESGRWPADLGLLAASLAGAVAVLLLPRWSRWRAFEAAKRENPTPSAMDKRRRVAFMAISRGVLAAAAGALLYAAAMEVGLVREAEQVLALRIWIGLAALTLVWNFARSALSPRDERWRTAQVGSRAAGPLCWIGVAIFCLFLVDRVLAAGFELAGAGPQLPLAVQAVSSGLSMVLLLLSIGIVQGPRAGKVRKTGSTPPAAGATPRPEHPRRELLLSAGRVLAILILAANALAYVALAGFVFHRFVLMGLFLILIYSARVLTLWALSALPFVAATPADTTERDQEKRRLGLWLRVAVDVALLALAIPAFVLTVGYGWLDLQSWLGVLDAGVRIGAVSLSFQNILAAALAFLAISIGTRWATSIADKRFLARTSLDTGKRNSIVVLIKYAGIVLAFLVAFAIAGVSLSKLMIVAGGLSVGIGLGLQGVVNNFVSGLILLFERPIKIGDWVEVSAGQGYVKHIGPRATEIETFDRASIIIPNAELVTSAVQNWFYKNRIGRVNVAVGVGYGADPERVRDLLLGCAANNHSVMASPEPQVRWMDFGDSSLDFELRAYIANYDNALIVRSDLRFAIFKALTDAGIEIPFPQRDLHIRSDDTKGDPAPA